MQKILSFIFKSYHAFLLALLLLNCNFSSAQFLCGNTPISEVRAFSPTFAGLYQPLRTDMDGNTPISDGYIRILIVFVQYQSDFDSPEWPTDGAPIYMDSVIATTFSNPANWWEAYNPNTQLVSDYWMNVSKGRMNVIGDVYSVVLSESAEKYSNDSAINSEIWENLKDQGLTNWKQYDNWKDTTIAGETKFLHHPDGYVDMIYKIHKNHEGHLPQDAGYSQLGLHYQGDFEVDTNHTKISCSQGFGSGITFSYCPSKHIIFNSIFHEHGHNLYSLNHMTYAKVGYGAGYDGFFSPLESILMNYMRPTTVNFASPTNILGDYNSHDTTRGNILKVPIQGNECFLLANRGNVSKWDKVMIGDTATINGPFQDYGDYGKGLYIYHLKDGIRFPIGDEVLQDQECADRLFVWSGAGTAHRYSFDKGYCNDAGMWDFYAKSEVSYDNDTGYGTTLHSDDKSLGMGGQLYSWFGTGKANTNTCLNNTDRQFTTSSNIVTMDKHAGDRYDAWKVGYNEVFSPYSSPSTKTWYNDESGIFIYLKGTNNTSHTDTIKIYSTAEDPEEDILTATAPKQAYGIAGPG